MELKLHGKIQDLYAGDHAVLNVEAIGRVSRYGIAPGAEPLRDMLGDEVYRQGLMLSLEKCEYLDSSGVEWLLHCHSRFERGGGRLVIHSAKPKVMQLLRIMRMPMVLRIAEDLEKAKIIMNGKNESHEHGNGHEG